MATERLVPAVKALIAAGVAAIVAAGCTPANTSPSTHAAASSAAARVRAVATSTAVRGDENDAVNNILAPCIQTAGGLSSLQSCIENKLPEATRQQAVRCLLIAGLHGGKKAIEGTAGQVCVAAALSPSPSPSSTFIATSQPSPAASR